MEPKIRDAFSKSTFSILSLSSPLYVLKYLFSVEKLCKKNGCRNSVERMQFFSFSEFISLYSSMFEGL
jgi:hypothetical protein